MCNQILSRMPAGHLLWDSLPSLYGAACCAALMPTLRRRGYLDIDEGLLSSKGLLPDSYLDASDWGKGLAFINGFNLGWYWPSKGPANTL